MKDTTMTELEIAIAKLYAQGGPPPGNACNTPNPPPWCDQPTVPIDNWQMMTALILTAIIFGFYFYRKPQEER